MAYKILGDAQIGRRVSADLAINAPEWVSGKDYLTNDIFVSGGVAYVVTADHTSTTSPAADSANLSPVGSALDRAFADATGVAALDPVNPTVAEIQAWAAGSAVTDNIIYYTGTDVATDAITHVFHADASGDVTLLRRPQDVADTIYNADGTLTGARSVDLGGFSLSLSNGTSINAAADSIELNANNAANGSVKFLNLGNGDIQVGSLGGDLMLYGHGVPYLWPAADGVDGQVLGTDGLGGLTWVDRGNNRVFADEATVAPAVAGQPTVAEMATFAAAIPRTDTILYYTGTNAPGDAVTHVFHVDHAGAVTLLLEPQVVTVDRNTTVSDESGGTYAGGAPASAPANPDTGDLHIEIYDDVNAYFTAVGGAWPAAAQVVESRDLTKFADATLASDDASGNGGVAVTAARSDHKHAAQGVSADADNALIVGTDGLHFYKANDRVHADDTTVAPAAAGSPTVAEIAVFAAAGPHLDKVIYYTGDDLPASVPTHVFHVDASGNVTLLLEPAPVLSYEQTFAAAAWSAPSGGYRTISVPSATHGLGASVKSVTVWEENGTDYDEVGIDRVRVANATGDVELRIVDGAEFSGKVSIS